MNRAKTETLIEALEVGCWTDVTLNSPVLRLTYEEATELMVALDLGEAREVVSLRLGGVPIWTNEEDLRVVGSVLHVVDYEGELYLIGGRYDQTLQEALDGCWLD